MNDPWATPRGIATLVLVPIATAFAFIVAYGQWDAVGLADIFFMRLQHVAWIRVSLLMTLITGLAGSVSVRKGGLLESPISYAGIVIPIVVVLMPGITATIGEFEAGAAIKLLILLAVVHGFAFSQVRRVVGGGGPRVNP